MAQNEHSLAAFMTQIKPRRAVCLGNCIHFKGHYGPPELEFTHYKRVWPKHSIRIGRKITFIFLTCSNILVCSSFSVVFILDTKKSHAAQYSMYDGLLKALSH